MDENETYSPTPLEKMIDLSHPLCRLARAINWKKFEKHFAKHSPYGRHPKETRLIVGLYYLKFAFNVSDEVLLEHWLENPYWQYFCGEKEFRHTLPLDRTTIVKRRRSLDSKKFDMLLEETIDLGIDFGVLKKSDLKKASVDTTVMEKAVAFPTDIRLCHKAREKLVSLAKGYDIPLRQSYVRKGKRHLYKYGRYAHARQYKRAAKELKSVRNYLGRVIRDIERNLPWGDDIPPPLADMLLKAKRLYEQKKNSKKKLYSLHMPEVECIAKGKAHKKYEFGCKVGLVSSLKGNFILGMQALHDNPFDGHTLRGCLSQAEALSKVKFKEVYVDQGYNGHRIDDRDITVVNWRKKKVTRSKREKMKRRSAIEPLIGHIKNDHGHFRNHLLGRHGDRVSAVLLGTGFNLRKLIRFLNKGRKIFDGFPDSSLLQPA